MFFEKIINLKQATIKGTEFSDMTQRHKEASEALRIKREEYFRKEKEIEEAASLERNRTKEINMNNLIKVTKNDLTWNQIQQNEHQQRTERIERRKLELSLMSSLPKSMLNPQPQRRSRSFSSSDEFSTEFIAEDPDKVLC
jgi:hypothetical protein